MKSQRLDKIISNQFNVSRSIARRDIKRGKVSVDDTVVRDFSAQVEVTSQICYLGQAMVYKKYTYIVMNKPKGILSASNDSNRETVVDLVDNSIKRQGLFPVGRLDKDTTGLLLITDDGNFSHSVISPKKNICKIYEAELDGTPEPNSIELFRKGVVLADGYRCKPSELEILENNRVLIKITEGKYHQIKRMFGAIGLGVNSLKRISIGGLFLPPDLKEGESRELTETEKSNIFKIC